MFKFIAELVAANLITDAIRSPGPPSQREIDAHDEAVFNAGFAAGQRDMKQAMLRLKAQEMIAQMTVGKDMTAAQLASLEQLAEEEVQKNL